MKLRKFRLVANAVGRLSELFVDDVPWHAEYAIRRVAVTTGVDEPTQLFVTLQGDGLVEGEGIITQVVEVAGASPLAWLDSIDADELDEAVNAELQLEPGSYAELALKVLRGWANRGE